MSVRKRIWLAIGLASLAPVAPHGAEAPRPGYVDPRIRTVVYNPEQVITLRGHLGYQMMVEFAPYERIENVSIGDSLAWQVTPNHKANLLFLKPVDPAVVTNMTVVTDLRRYAFELSARRAAGSRPLDMAYVVRFLYPQDALPPPPKPAPPAPPARRNTAYTYAGSRASLPSLVFDDGQFTYFRWPENTPTPALFQVGPDGSESLINYGVRNGYLVVEQIASRFVLRNGKEVTILINNGWREPAAGALAPTPADPKTARDATKAAAKAGH